MKTSIVYLEQLDVIFEVPEIYEIGAEVEVQIGSMNLGTATVIGVL